MGVDRTSLPLPDDPALASVARALEARGFAAEIWDAQWRLVYLSSEYRILVSAGRSPTEDPVLGRHVLSRESSEARESWPTGPTFESWRESLRDWGGFVVSGTPGGLEHLRTIADPRLAEVLGEVTPTAPAAAWGTRVDVRFGTETIGNDVLVVGVRGADGDLAGFVGLVKPEVRAAVLGMLALGDVRLFERMSALLEPARRPAGVLFADLENSTALARRLSTPAYLRTHPSHSASKRSSSRQQRRDRRQARRRRRNRVLSRRRGGVRIGSCPRLYRIDARDPGGGAPGSRADRT